MSSTLLRPRWLLATVVVLVLAGVFVRLGFWQLDRLEERRTENEQIRLRLETAAVPLASLIDSGRDLDSLEYSGVIVSGVYDASQEVLIRSQVERGEAGFHVLTPLVLESGHAVLVNRGWVPLAMDTPPVDASPPTGDVEVEGWIHLSQTRPPLGPQEPAGQHDIFNRVDIPRISEQVDEPLLGVYVVAVGEQSELPIPVDPPDFGDEGPHLAYAIQWFAFAVIAVVGYYFLIRRRRPGPQTTLARSSTTS